MAIRGLPRSRAFARAFTLIEILVTMSIVVIVLGIASLSFHKLFDSNALQTAVSTLVSHASVARAYAIQNQTETMLVVNPINGRLEIWHANPQSGFAWDPNSGGDFVISGPAGCDGYAFAPVLDSSAALPLGADGKPLVVVHPIDYVTDFGPPAYNPLRPYGNAFDTNTNRDNYNWVAVCFDANGRMVNRMRRIATRLPAAASWYSNSDANPNRRIDGTPDDARKSSPALNTDYYVDIHDSLITSAPGFIVSDRKAFQSFFQQEVTGGTVYTTAVFDWLNNARPGWPNQKYAQFVLLSQWSGAPLATVE